MRDPIRIIVAALIVHKHKLLVIQRTDRLFGQKYSIPGGGIEFGETPIKALKRELKEELALSIKKAVFLNYQTIITKDKHLLSLNFLVKLIKPNFKINKTEILTAQLVPIKKSNKLTKSVNSLIGLVKRKENEFKKATT